MEEKNRRTIGFLARILRLVLLLEGFPSTLPGTFEKDKRNTPSK